MTDLTPEQEQQEYYKHIKANHTFQDIRNDTAWYLKGDRAGDWLQIDSIGGVDYYTPNDEDWGSVLAVSEEHKIARKTGFYEMTDMESPNSDYAQVVSNGQIMCRFEA